VPTSDSRPNIVVILVDDMGYSDLGCYGSEIRTPSLDGMAERGIRFSQFYITPRWASSRAAGRSRRATSRRRPGRPWRTRSGAT